MLLQYRFNHRIKSRRFADFRLGIISVLPMCILTTETCYLAFCSGTWATWAAFADCGVPSSTEMDLCVWLLLTRAGANKEAVLWVPSRLVLGQDTWGNYVAIMWWSGCTNVERVWQVRLRLVWSVSTSAQRRTCKAFLKGIIQHAPSMISARNWLDWLGMYCFEMS